MAFASSGTPQPSLPSPLLLYPHCFPTGLAKLILNQATAVLFPLLIGQVHVHCFGNASIGHFGECAWLLSNMLPYAASYVQAASFHMATQPIAACLAAAMMLLCLNQEAAQHVKWSVLLQD